MRSPGQVGFLASPDGAPRQGETPDESRDSSAREQLPLALPGPTQWLVYGVLGLGGAYVLTKVAEWLLNPEDVVPNPPECPLTKYSFGGISMDDGFGSATEYEIGARRIVDSCSCVLGELGKGAYYADRNRDKDWFVAARISTAYIDEKVKLVVYVRREYSKQLYTDRMVPARILEMGYHDPEQAIESARKSVYSIRHAAPALIMRSADMAERLSGCNLPEPVHNLAFWCYVVIESLGECMLDGVEDFPERVKDPFGMNRLASDVYMLEHATKKFFAAQEASGRH